ncbi:hypothetical protein WMF38_51655 [Sorangium sp. So ce118]
MGFGSWLGYDRVFDATSRQSVEAPPSARAGAQLAVSARSGPFGAHLSGTYTHAPFTGSDERFREGDPVPYAPAFVLRDDVFASGAVGKLLGKEVTVRVGAGVEGAAGRSLPGERAGRPPVPTRAAGQRRPASSIGDPGKSRKGSRPWRWADGYGDIVVAQAQEWAPGARLPRRRVNTIKPTAYSMI